ncbi:MAG: hypothetical protein ACMXYK_04690 [Candidatus Woesearchaeota archaeon]
MALENIVIAGDWQDMGAIPHNLTAIDKTLSTIASTFDSSNTTVILNGDITDNHAFYHRDMDGDFDAANEPFYQNISDEGAKEIYEQNSGKDYDSLPAEAKEDILLQIKKNFAGDAYIHEVNNIIKEKLVDKGFETKAVMGNNEFLVCGAARISPDQLPYINEQLRTMIEQQTGISYIDRSTDSFQEIGGVKVISDPYWIMNGGNKKRHMELGDHPDPEKSPIYKKLNDADLQKGEHVVLALHGGPDKKYGDVALNTFLAETSQTVFVTHGHGELDFEKDGERIHYETNDNGGEIFYVNTNNLPANKRSGYSYANLRAEDGKVLGIDISEVCYK